MFQYPYAIVNIKARTDKYFDKFFELSNLDTHIEKRIVDVFYNCMLHLPDSFDNMLKSATDQAKNTKLFPFSNLLDMEESENDKAV